MDGFLQQFCLIIKYNKESTNKLEGMLSRPPISNITALGTLIYMEHFTHDVDQEEYIEDEDFKEVFQLLQGQFHVEEGDIKTSYILHDGYSTSYTSYMLLNMRHCSLS